MMSAFFLTRNVGLDKEITELSQAAPLCWLQLVEIEGARVRIEEEITTANGTTIVRVDAKADGPSTLSVVREWQMKSPPLHMRSSSQVSVARTVSSISARP